MDQLVLNSIRLSPLGLSLFLAGCVLAPRESKDEANAMQIAGKPYQKPFEQRELPELPSEPTSEDLLRRALLANGEVEAAYHEWEASIHRIQQAGGYPNTPLTTSFSYTFSGGQMSAFDRTTVSVGPDPMENLAFPPKVYQAAKVALDEARAARKRFVAATFEVRRRVRNAWAEYALLGEQIRIQQENVSLLKIISDTAVSRVQAGGQQQDLIRVETEYRVAADQLKSQESKVPQQRAMLNALLARDQDASLEPPRRMPSSRPAPADDAKLIALAAQKNPELASIAHQVAGREDALDLARLQYIPDFNPFAGFTGSISQVVGIGISIPTMLPKVAGRVKEARAELAGALAMYRQKKFNQAAAVIAALYTLRNSDRQERFYEDQVIPAAERVLGLSRQAYSSGTGSFLELIESQRTLLQVRLGVAEAAAAREQALADLEALLAVDMETLSKQVDGQSQASEVTIGMKR